MSDIQEQVLTSPTSALVDTSHRDLRDDEYWRAIPAYADLRADEFHEHRFQSRNSVTSLKKLREVLGSVVSEAFYRDVEQGLLRSPMSLRISPYILSLIDWSEPAEDPLRIQFLPMESRMWPDHPELALDSLHEQVDSPVPGLTHRYADRALFLTLDTCPVYCRFCTRSYAVGLDTEDVEKVHFGAIAQRWEQVFAYIASRPELEDIVISGGDVANLKAEHIEYIGTRLLSIEHVRRMRYATKAPAIMPQKLVTDREWVDALTRVVEAGRKIHKEVALHTHFNHPREITAISGRALDELMERGICVRNQTVLQRGVNDDVNTMQHLVRQLSYLNVHPYYTFVHDMVRGVEELRTTLAAAISLEKAVRGQTAGFNTPAFVLDTMGGGGKRDVHSYEHYDRQTGIAVFTSPAVRPGEFFFYYDPLDALDPLIVQRWSDPAERAAMRQAALEAACQT
ncbi:MAG: KamA family radical SAM protein [Gemmatimonadetes bacterium]|nr:KamA family radical SAM protein [Gemmatimonadota bacterium]MYB70103.1 KamA family radical SAM protein [Gemmatimonadota bacterium]